MQWLKLDITLGNDKHCQHLFMKQFKTLHQITSWHVKIKCRKLYNAEQGIQIVSLAFAYCNSIATGFSSIPYYTRVLIRAQTLRSMRESAEEVRRLNVDMYTKG